MLRLGVVCGGVVSAGGGGDGECGPEGASEGTVVVVMSAGWRGRAR